MHFKFSPLTIISMEFSENAGVFIPWEDRPGETNLVIQNAEAEASLAFL